MEIKTRTVDGIDFYPLSQSQSVVLMGEFCGKNYANIGLLFHFEGETNEALLEKALKLALERFPTRQTRLRELKPARKSEKKAVWQYFKNEPEPDVICKAFSSDDEMYRYIRANTNALFPNKGRDVPMYHAELIRKQDGKHVIYMKAHHIIADAYGLMVLSNDFIGIYAALRDKAELPPAPAPVLPAYQQEWDYIGSELEARDTKFWNEYWDALDAPYYGSINPYGEKTSKEYIIGDKTGKYVNLLNNKSGQLDLIFPKATNDRLNVFAFENHITPQAVFLTAIFTYYMKMRGTEGPFVLLNNLAQRSKTVFKKTGGSFATGFPCYLNFKKSDTVVQAAGAAAEMQAKLFRHTRVHPSKSLAGLERKSAKKLKGLWVRLFYSLSLTYQPYFINIDETVPFHIERICPDTFSGPMYLTIMAMDNSGNLTCDYQYNYSLYSEQSIRAFNDFLIRYVDAVCDNPDLTLASLMNV